MAGVFSEPGSDATGDLTFFTATVGTVVSSTTQARTGSRSFKCDSMASAVSYLRKDGIMADAGRRVTAAFYFEHFFDAEQGIMTVATTASAFSVRVSSTGVLQLWNSTVQIGSNGSTLSIGQWYRVTLAYIVTSTTVNEFRIYLNDSAVADISVSNATLTITSADRLRLGWGAGTGSTNRIVYVDDICVDDSTSLAAFSGDIHITNGHAAALNTNNFDTGIGSGTNRYDRVSEVPYSETNGWQHAAATDVQENYGLQTASAGDEDLTGATLISRTAWLIGKRGALTPCTFRAGAASGSTNPTTTFTITIPSGTATGDSLFVQVTSRDHTSGTAYPTVVDTDVGGNTWTQIAESTDRKATLWWKRATSGTASKVITVTGCVGSCTGGVSVYQNAATSVTPYTNIVVETNASADESHASFTPDNAGSAICFAVFNYANDNAVSSESTASLGAMTEDWEHLSTGGSDCACVHAHINGADAAPAATGDITWAQTNGTTYSISWAVRPEDSLGSPDIMDNGTETAIALTTSSALYTKITDSASYPSNAAGIGMRSGGGSVDTYLYECGTILAYIPGVAPSGPPAGSLALLGVGR
jgi:hypothetical protein